MRFLLRSLNGWPLFSLQALNMLGYIWHYVYSSFLRYWLKWLIRQVTGQCELQRICSTYKPGAPRTSRAGESKNPKCLYLSAFFMPLWNDFDLPFCAPSRVFSPFIKEQGKKVLVLALWISQRNVWITKPCFGHSFTSNLLSNNKTMWL